MNLMTNGHGWRVFVAVVISMGLNIAVGDGSDCNASEKVGANASPHVILILVDDMRWDFFSSEGHPYVQTPNLDRLALEGTSFRRCYVATPLCGPNRASINTGLLASRHGIINHAIHNDPRSLYPRGNFLPRTIHNLGVFTSTIGKYFHKPHDWPRPEYDRWFVHDGYNGNQHTARTYNIDGQHVSNADATAISGSATTYATDIEFAEIARLAGEHVNEQFFTFCSPFAPHSPFTPAPRHDGTYDGMPMPVTPNFNAFIQWVDFNPVASDRLLAEVDFTGDTVTSLEGTNSIIGNVNAGYVHGDFEYFPNQWGGDPDNGEFEVTGTYFNDGVSNIEPDRMDRGVAVADRAEGAGYLMYSKGNVHTRFGVSRVGNADHLIAVRLNGNQWQYNNDKGGMSITALDTLETKYNDTAEMILAIDEGMGLLYEQLESQGILEDTVIIFTSDNGIQFGEHAYPLVRKKVPHEESCRMPLIVRYGSNVVGQGPVDANQLVSQADLMMTITELMGAEIPPAAPGKEYYGRSLAGEWLGSNGAGDVERREDLISIYYNAFGPDNSDNFDNDGMVWASIVTDDGWKYVDVNLYIGADVSPIKYEQIINGLEPRLINLNDDPYELNNLARKCEYSLLRSELQQRLSDQLLANGAEFVFQPASPEVFVDWIEPIRGTYLSGDESSLLESDDNYLLYRAGRQTGEDEPRVLLEFEGSSPCLDPNRLTFSIESYANRSGVRQTVEVFNYYEEEYETVDVQFIAEQADTSINIDLMIGTHYISSDERFKVRVGYYAPRLKLAAWEVGIDKIDWQLGN